MDLNADLAEECGDDNALYPHLSSANVCCGQHAGGPVAMRAAVRAAMRHNVAIGAHVGYADRENFGRLPVEMDHKSLYALTMSQLRDLQAIIDEEGGHMRYVKPHGALYHRIGEDSAQAHAVIDAIADFNPSLDVLIPDTPVIKNVAALRFLRTAHEFFADRAYLANGQLAPRSMPGSVIEDTIAIVERVRKWVNTGNVDAIDGSVITVDAKSICVHGDTPGAVEATQAIHESLLMQGFDVKSWLD